MESNIITTPTTYYGGKQKLISTILPLFPTHTLYGEPFIGGGAIFWAKRKSPVEVINDTNREMINFYKTCQNDFELLERHIKSSLHSRSLHRDAKVINENPHMFSTIDRAWAVWVLASQSFASILDGSWGYDKIKNTTSKKVSNKRDAFTKDLLLRLEHVQIECTDALRIIESRDGKENFFYCDPPYFNSDCGHYDGYTKEDFEMLLKTLSQIEGKFLLSSYPSDVLKKYKNQHGWSQMEIEQEVLVANKTGKRKAKTEVLTANYNLTNPREEMTLF